MVVRDPCRRPAGRRARCDRLDDDAYVSEHKRFHSPRIIPGPITRLGSRCRRSIMINRINATRRRVEPRVVLVALRCPVRQSRRAGRSDRQFTRSQHGDCGLSSPQQAARNCRGVPILISILTNNAAIICVIEMTIVILCCRESQTRKKILLHHVRCAPITLADEVARFTPVSCCATRFALPLLSRVQTRKHERQIKRRVK